jgi:hypothetical protein
LLRLFRFERYTHAFTSFDDVISRNADVLAITGFSAILVWVFFAAWLYFTERDNPDDEMAVFYKTVPDAMWVTLLNLAGESPLSQYSSAGKVATGILGLFATAIFGIPIGLLGAGFEEVVAEENEDNTEELEQVNTARSTTESYGTSFEKAVYDFVNGDGSTMAKYFEMSIYVFILGAVAVGVWQTVEGEEDAYANFETLAVVVFTIEYLMRFIGVGSDPEFAAGRNFVSCRLHFIISFYSVVDLLAIAPFYLAVALPNSIVDEYDEYLRMLRILRLAKLDKYVPSLTLIDDVIRLKFNQLRVAFYAAVTLWILFAAIMFDFEHGDYENEIDPVPLYGCDENCTMVDRFQNFFDSMVYTGIHLTGDCKYSRNLGSRTVMEGRCTHLVVFNTLRPDHYILLACPLRQLLHCHCCCWRGVYSKRFGRQWFPGNCSEQEQEEAWSNGRPCRRRLVRRAPSRLGRS